MFSAKSRYGLKFVLDLANLRDDELGQRKVIAKRQGIPENYVEHIVICLKNGGMIESFRGKGGGICLSRSPAHISLWELFSTLEDPLNPVACIDQPCVNETLCGSKDAWQTVLEIIKEPLEKTTIADIKGDAETPFVNFETEIRACPAPSKTHS